MNIRLIFRLTCFFYGILSFSTLSLAAQDPHFAKQLLNLENELEEFRDRIDEKERQIRSLLRGKTQKLYKLRQRQRDGTSMNDAEKQKLAKEIEALNESIKQDRLRMSEVQSALEKKRKDIFSLKLNIDEWVARVEAAEVAVIERIKNMKNDITELIDKLDKEFPRASSSK